MATKTMSIIRYKYKADRDFESVQFEGMSCSLGELKRLIIEKSVRSGTHHTRDDCDLIISNTTTHEEYRNNSEMIPRNTSVFVTRRIRGLVESLTPSANQQSFVSSDDIVNDYLRPAIFQSTHLTTSSTMNTTAQSSVVESKAIPLEMLTQPTNNTLTNDIDEEERIKELIKSSQNQYLAPKRSKISNSCHHCNQTGHMKYQCPQLLQSSSTNSFIKTTGSTSLSTGDPGSNADGTKSNSSNQTPRSVSVPSHILTNQTASQSTHQDQQTHRHPGNRYQNRVSGHSRNEPPAKKPTGIPRDGLIHIPRRIPGALMDQTGASVVPRAMAQLLVEKSEEKADPLAQRARQFQEKGVLPPAPPASMLLTKSADEDKPPNDLLCPICKQIYTDAVITPCCHNSFCDECIRNSLIESEDHECPYCHRQYVAVDQINPNLFLRKCVDRWREERQNKPSHSTAPISRHTSTNNPSSTTISIRDTDSILLRDATSLKIENSNDNDQHEMSTITISSVVPMKTGPIVIKMQPIVRSPSPKPIVVTKPADPTFEDSKVLDTDQTLSDRKTINSDTFVNKNESIIGRANTTNGSSNIENEKSNRQTPPSQVAPVNTILSSPPTNTTTTMAVTPSVVPHYYPNSSYNPSHHQHDQHGGISSQQISIGTSSGLYPAHHPYYPPPMLNPTYIPSVLPVGVPGGPLHHYSGQPPFVSVHAHHAVIPSHVQMNTLNGYRFAHFEDSNVGSLYHPGGTYAATSTSTLIAHHQTGAPMIPTPLSKDEFYFTQRQLKETPQTAARHRSRSNSSSDSSYASSKSRSSSFSRHTDHHHRRVNDHRRNKSRRRSSSRHHSRPRRRSSSRHHSRSRRRSHTRHTSPSHRYRRAVAAVASQVPSNSHSSSHRRLPAYSHRSTQGQERRRSPRPPPTIQQSIQRTIVYVHESSSSKHSSVRDHERVQRRSKSNSRHHSRVNDDRTAPLFKDEQQSRSESKRSSSPMTVPVDRQQKRLPSTIEAITNNKSFNNSQSIDINYEKDCISGAKRKKDHHNGHHKKHRRHHSQSPNPKNKEYNNNESDLKRIVTTSTSGIEI